MVCVFKPADFGCKAGAAADCLSAPQIEALEAIIAGGKNRRAGEPFYPGYPLAARLLPGPVAGMKPDSAAPQTFRIVFDDPAWDYRTMNFDGNIARSDKMGYQKMNAVNPEKLKPLFARGGKIPMYHGWIDPAISPLISIKLYQDAVAANGGAKATADAIRLFMLPGKAHCGNPFDQMSAITEWVEHGRAPIRCSSPIPWRARRTTPRRPARAQSALIRKWRNTRDRAVPTRRSFSCVSGKAT